MAAAQVNMSFLEQMVDNRHCGFRRAVNLRDQCNYFVFKVFTSVLASGLACELLQRGSHNKHKMTAR